MEERGERGSCGGRQISIRSFSDTYLTVCLHSSYSTFQIDILGYNISEGTQFTAKRNSIYEGSRVMQFIAPMLKLRWQKL